MARTDGDPGAASFGGASVRQRVARCDVPGRAMPMLVAWEGRSTLRPSRTGREGEG